MVSPSSSVRMRMMPCIAGCAGPMPTWMFWLPAPVPAPSPSMNSRRAVSGMRTDERLAAVDRIVLAQRVADELLVHQEAPGVGMAVEAHAEHVPHLALEPVGDRPEGGGRRHHRVVLLDAHLQAHAVVVG